MKKIFEKLGLKTAKSKRRHVALPGVPFMRTQLSRVSELNKTVISMSSGR